jgi:hypothetical protein
MGHCDGEGGAVGFQRARWADDCWCRLRIGAGGAGTYVCR